MKKSLKVCIAAGILAAVISSPVVAQNYYARQILNKSAINNGGGTEPPSSQGQWTTGEWSGWDSQCSLTATRTRPVLCMVDGVISDDTQCHLSKPEASETRRDYSGCTTILQNGNFYPSLAGWQTSVNVTTSHLGSSSRFAVVPIGGWISQTTIMPLEAGITYRFNSRAEAQGGTAFYPGSRVIITSNGETLVDTTITRGSGIRIDFSGSGHPIHILIQNTNGRGMNYGVASITKL